MGNTVVTLTGDMKGLDPKTVYTVFVSNGWTNPKQVWDVTGNWVLRAEGGYFHDFAFTMQQWQGTVSGLGTYPDGGPTSIWETVTGTVTGITVNLHGVYYSDAARLVPTGYEWNAVLAIDNITGSMSGTVSDNQGNSDLSFVSTSGSATYITVGNYPGLFNNLQTFTFTTSANGEGSWHLNLVKSDFPGTGPYTLSVWINNAIPATILISNNFVVTIN